MDLSNEIFINKYFFFIKLKEWLIVKEGQFIKFLELERGCGYWKWKFFF